MAIKTDAELNAQTDAVIKVNGNREITPGLDNALRKNEIASKLSIKDGGRIVQALTGYLTNLTPSDDRDWTPKKYVDDQVAAVSAGGLLAANNLDDLDDLPTALVNLGLNNVNNTSDSSKPVSTAQAAADAAVLASAQTYADALVVGLWDDRGNYNASVNTFPASGGSGSAGAVKKGDIWTVSVAGTLGGHSVTAGDTVRALIDTPGQTDSNWAIAENNIGYTPQAQLVSGTNIKTINGSSLLGSGDLTVSTTFASQSEVNAGTVNNKAIAPDTNKIFVNNTAIAMAIALG